MAKPTISSLTSEAIVLHEQIASQQSEIIALREQCEQYKALNDVQAERLTKAVVAYKRDQAEIATMQAEIAELREQLAAKPQAPAPKPKAPPHKAGEFVEPPRYATFKGVQHRAYYGRTDNAIGWKPV